MELTIHSKESEQAIVGSVLINPDVYDDCKGIIGSTDFYFVDTKAAWKAIETLKRENRDVDIITVAEAAKNDGVTSYYLAQLVSMSPNSWNAKSYAETILDKSRRRKQIDIASEIVRGAHNGGVKVSEIVSQLVSTTNIKRRSETLGRGLSEYYDTIMDRYANPREVWGISTGFKNFDIATGGLHKKQVVMVSGAPGTGKSALCANFILKSAMQGTRWGIYEMEMAQEELINRWVGMLTGMSETQLSSGKFPESKLDSVVKAIETLEGLPIYINDAQGLSSTDVEADLSAILSEQELDAVHLDYLELMSDEGDNANEASKKKSKEFRRICKEMNLAGLVIQSMTKDGISAATGGISQKDGGRKSFVSAQAAQIGVSGPSAVIHDADKIFMLVVDPDDTTGKTIAALPAKNRQGSGSKRPLRFEWDNIAPILKDKDSAPTFAPNR